MSYTAPTVEEVQARRAELAPFDSINERIWLAWYASVLVWRGIPASYLDLGSGTGAMVNMARRIGIDAYGVDVINGPEYWFIDHDLTEPLILSTERMAPSNGGPYTYVPASLEYSPRTFELVTCLEVAEHLPEAAADTLCDSIVRHLPRGGILVFSAAAPGQGGEHHLNLRPAWYWRSKFHERGVSYREDHTRQLSHLWSWVAGPLQWLPANVQVFDK